MRRSVKLGVQLLVSGGIIAFLLWSIDLEQAVEIIRDSHWGYVLAAFLIFVGTTWLMTWRWSVLLQAKGVHEPFSWLLRLYFVSYTFGQVLPTAVGGDAVRIIEHSRRRPNEKASAAAAVFMERVLGSAGTLVLVAIGLAVAVGRYDDVRFLAIIEVVFVAVMIVLGLLLFSRRLGLALERRLFPLGRRVKLEKPMQSLYWAMHEYRQAPGALAVVLGVTVVAQLLRVIAIWLCGEAVGADVSPVVYVILGPLLFLVQMVPFTLNGLGLREAFFVLFLGRFDVPEDVAFAAGFLYYAVTIATCIPGAVILLWRSVRPAAPAQ
ncbi:MAG TPA: lysylphosphatidylglycerol synthase transmembrane domain-containing protein [Gaiellaceae bacterium]|nr:lysylphosphatidylglycerol synthase transmembrane domain-containing protein [Gaiellaceae bacterium]